MTDKPIDQMTRDELEATATSLGIKFAHNAGDDTLRGRIAEALGQINPGTTPAPVTNEPAPAPEPEPEPAPARAKRFEIIIATHDQDKQPVPVGVNGRMYIITRGKKVIVPEAVVEVLTHAVRDEYDPETMELTQVMAYPFQVLREV